MKAWKYPILVLTMVWAVVYSLPNVYGEDPAVQVASPVHHFNPQAQVQDIQHILTQHHLSWTAIEPMGNSVHIRFKDTATQLKARDQLKANLGPDHTVALNLAHRTPHWLQSIGAFPMKLGLDLRGGVHFLLNVDLHSYLNGVHTTQIAAMTQRLRTEKLRYQSSQRQPAYGFTWTFPHNTANQAKALLAAHFNTYDFSITHGAEQDQLTATISSDTLAHIIRDTMDQTLNILRNRVNELGISEAIVQRQGVHHVSVDLPGIQDTARAKALIGKTATLRFHFVDTEHDLSSVVSTGHTPPDSRLYYDAYHQPVLLKNTVVLKGDAITYATALFREGSPSVNVRLDRNEHAFNRITATHIGQPLAVVLSQIKPEKKILNGNTITLHKKQERVISIATVQSALGSNFDITGLRTMDTAKNLALLLRSGALIAPVDVVEELTIGPNLGQSNIQKGVISLLLGSALVIVFMMVYYRLFGLIANLALLFNVLLITATLSLLGGTLTLPGIAGMVLTVGMAVDANVLINERIREELRRGVRSFASIQIGYNKAFATIVDANVTTLIVAVVLCTLGSGSVKGFAITLIIGLIASLFTAIFFTRTLIESIYATNPKPLSIGIRY